MKPIKKNTIFKELEKTLMLKDKYLSKDGEILKGKVYDDCMSMDHEFIELIFDNEVLREQFFIKIRENYVFDKVEFTWILESKEFLPDSYTLYKNKIGLVDKSNNMITKTNDIELVWPYKDCVLVGGQDKEEQKRDEIFYNETLAPDEVNTLLEPKVFTKFKRYNLDNMDGIEIEEINKEDNLIIKGNNLLVLSSLVERYESKIKCIYIDPPYNTKSDANTFLYNNTFNRSSWLTFMKNRLDIAKRLLSDDGVLIIAIDKNERAYLEVMVREMYKDYTCDVITIVHNPRGVQGENFSYTHEYAMFIYPKGGKYISDKKLYGDEIKYSNLRNWGGESLRTDAKNCFYPIIIENDEIIGFGEVEPDDYNPSEQTVKKDGKYYVYPIDRNGVERKWRYARQTVESIKHLLKPIKTEYGYEVHLGRDYEKYRTVWMDPKYDANEYGTKVVAELSNKRFSFPKSLYTVKDCINAAVGDDKDAIILDFFAGSGTTGHAVMDINKEDNGNRKFILVEQMDYIKDITLPRIKNSMKTNYKTESLTYMELKKLNQKYIENIELAKNKEELNKIKDKILKSNFVSYKVNIKDLLNTEEEYNDLDLELQKKVLLEILDKNKLYVNYCDIEDKDYKLSPSEKSFTNSFYKGED